MEKVERLMHNK